MTDPAQHTPTPSVRSIMIVDDDAAIIDVLLNSLNLEGYSCDGYQRAEEALEALERGPVEVLLTDIVMPGMRGLDLVAHAKRLHPGLTAVVMTGFVEEFTYDEAIRSGAVDFIKKPFTTQELLVRLKHARLQEHLRELSITDELTGLANRRGFFAFAQQQLKQVRRTGERLVLLFADLDGFKTVNDSLGHLAGDRMLADTARILRETFRDSDIIARMGGDEFAVLLVNAPESGVEAARTRLRQRIGEYNGKRSASGPMLSVSLGMTVYDSGRHQTVDALVREADMQMYAEKRGRKAAVQDES